ncbi:hypothetical protein AAIB41_06205 [Brucella sp. BE17]|uniref:hypothetical protein n=1 Tax=Brucella sp. BE17 TaxID=3142977 RepID=UPI0031BAE7D0
MQIAEELQRRIEKSMADGGFTPDEMLLRRAHRMSRGLQHSDEASADDLLKSAGFSFNATTLSKVLSRKPWLLSEIILSCAEQKHHDEAGHQ